MLCQDRDRKDKTQQKTELQLVNQNCSYFPNSKFLLMGFHKDTSKAGVGLLGFFCFVFQLGYYR